jgi:CDP-2,3-bis-(O-geranylgeranyl)-sn-glycerol synthase
LVVGVGAACAAYEVEVLLDGSTWLRDIVLIDYVHQPFWPGFLMGAGAIGGDAIKSFFNRQTGIVPSSRWLVFEHLDFFFGTSLLLSVVQPLPLAPWLAVLPMILVCDFAITALAYSLVLKEAWI